MCVDPDGGVAVVGHNGERIAPASRNVALPRRVQEEWVYYFDPVSEHELRQFHFEASPFAKMLGAPSAVVIWIDAKWYFSDPAHEKFSLEIDPELLRVPMDSHGTGRHR